MKKKLLFFAYTLDMGGAEKVMLDFITVLQERYDVDIALLKAQGDFLSSVPEGVDLISMRKGFFSYLLFRYIPFFRKRTIRKIAACKDYAAAVGFLEGRSATWVADIRKNIRRIAWVHINASLYDIGISDREVRDSYGKMDTVVFVSEDARKQFDARYGVSLQETRILYNLIDEKTIRQKAQAKVPANSCFTFINVGRMSVQKRQDRLIEVASLLKQDGFSFKIQIAGGGPEEAHLRQLIGERNVSDVVELLGVQQNPYPYVRQADCFVLSSDYEGYSLAVKEALLLGTPVVSTDVTGTREMLHDGQYGVICAAETGALYEAMKQVLLSQDILDQYRCNLKNYAGEAQSIIDGLFAIMEGTECGL